MKKYSPLKGSSYVLLPKCIQAKKACINVRNNDNQCFKYAILSALYPSDINTNRVTHYRQYEDKLNFAGIEFPVKLKDISKFEKLNDISVNVYMLRMFGAKFEVSPCHITLNKRERHVNLLIVQDFYIDEYEENNCGDDGNLPRYHYVWIKNMSRLLNAQLSKSHGKSFHCDRCLQIFYDEDRLKIHEEDCKNDCRINLPDPKDNILKFEDYKKSERIPFIIYVDFECLLQKTENENAFQLHQAYSMGYYLKCSFNNELSGYNSFRQEEGNCITAAEWFVQELKFIGEKIDALYKFPKPMKLSDLEELSFQKATICHICQKSIGDNQLKVRDHCHLTGWYVIN